jgi:hypothetical protein
MHREKYARTTPKVGIVRRNKQGKVSGKDMRSPQMPPMGY